MNPLLSTAYWPNLHYFYYVLNNNTIHIELEENFQKQSFRNRTEILTANGKLFLTIPVTKKSVKELTKYIEINYKENWQSKHWGAITSAYRNSPYFDYFEDEIKEFYTQQYPTLIEYNQAQLKFILKLLKQTRKIVFTEIYEKAPVGLTDLRESIHPKKNFITDKTVAEHLLSNF
jgi:hypothetical protein